MLTSEFTRYDEGVVKLEASQTKFRIITVAILIIVCTLFIFLYPFRFDQAYKPVSSQMFSSLLL